MTTTATRAQNLYYGDLPDLNTGADFILPEDGAWMPLIFRICRVQHPQTGEMVPEARVKIYQGQEVPGKHQIRLELSPADPSSDVSPWRNWFGWSLAGQSNRLRPMLEAINDGPLDPEAGLGVRFLERFEGKAFMALIGIDERVDQSTGQVRYFANVLKCKPYARRQPGQQQRQRPAAPPPPPPPLDDGEEIFHDVPDFGGTPEPDELPF